MRFNSLLKGLLSLLLVISLTRAARPQCSAQSCVTVGDLLRRSQLKASHNGTSIFNARALEVVPDDAGSISTYVTTGVNNLPVGNKIYNDRSSSTASTTLFRAFGRTNSDNTEVYASSFNIGLRFLTGCTALVIVSNRGVYAAHFYEDNAMNPALNTYAATLLRSGGTNFESIESHLGDLDGSPYGAQSTFPEVYIINPVKSAEAPEEPGTDSSVVDTRPASEIGFVTGQREYNQAYTDIWAVINSYWPNINTITEIPYYPLNINNKNQAQMPSGDTNPPDFVRLRTGAEGRIYFEYNKDRSSGFASVRLWVETAKLLEVTLNPV